MQFCAAYASPEGMTVCEVCVPMAHGSATVIPASIRTGTVHLIADPVAVSQELRRVSSYCVIFRQAVFRSRRLDAPNAKESPWPCREFPLANPLAVRPGCHSFCPHRRA